MNESVRHGQHRVEDVMFLLHKKLSCMYEIHATHQCATAISDTYTHYIQVTSKEIVIRQPSCHCLGVLGWKEEMKREQ